MTTAEALAAWDVGEEVSGHYLYLPNEQAAQVLTWEVVRECRARGLEGEAFNGVDDPTWDTLYAAALTAATQTDPDVATLTRREQDKAAVVAGSYVEHGYQAILDGSQPAAYGEFRRGRVTANQIIAAFGLDAGAQTEATELFAITNALTPLELHEVLMLQEQGIAYTTPTALRTRCLVL